MADEPILITGYNGTPSSDLAPLSNRLDLLAKDLGVGSLRRPPGSV